MVYGYIELGEKSKYIPHLISDTLHIDENMQSKEGKFFEILIDAGIKVPMMSGNYANFYNPYSGFYDTACHEMVTRSKLSDTISDVYCSEKSMSERHTVNMNDFIKCNINNLGLLRELAESACAGFDWTGTPYDPEKQNVTDYFSRR